MNFNELFQKMRELDQPVSETAGGTGAGGVAAMPMPMGSEQPEKELDECGDMPGPMSAPHQSDSVTMNVSMNGSGAGGIRDLMDILRNLEDEVGGEEGELGAIIDKMDDGHGEVMIDTEMDEYANSPDEMYAPVSRMTATGNDIHSQGDEAPKVNGGGNPMGMHEELVQRLSQQYDSIKEAAKWRDPKHKDKLYTQEPRSDEDDYYGDDDYYNPKPDDYPGAKNIKGGGEYDHNDPLKKGYGRYGHDTLDHGKRKGMPSRNHITSLKGSIKAAHGTHPRPNLPEQMNEAVELNAMLALNKHLNG